MQNKLYAKFASTMMVVCLRYAKNRPDAEELLQEGFIKVFTCLDQYKFKGPLEAWIKRIMINCALQKLRKQKALYKVEDCDSIPEGLFDKDLIVANLNVKEIIKHIQALPPMCRLVFNLYVFEGLKHREIAKLADISEGTSKSNLHDARIILKRRLQESIPYLNLNSGA